MILGLLHFFFLEELNLAFGKLYLLIFGHLEPTSLGMFVHGRISLQSSNDLQTGAPGPFTWGGVGGESGSGLGVPVPHRHQISFTMFFFSLKQEREK